jgi:hypothetical protein
MLLSLDFQTVFFAAEVSLLGLSLYFSTYLFPTLALTLAPVWVSLVTFVAFFAVAAKEEYVRLQA